MEGGRGRLRPSIQERLHMYPQSIPEQAVEMRSAEGAGTIKIPPAGSSSLKDIDNLVNIVSRLDISDGLMLKTVQFAIVHFCSSIPAMLQCVQRLHETAMDNQVFGFRAAAALATASNLVVNGVKLRNILITSLQGDFAKSEEVRKKNKTLFVNMVGFLGQVFSRVTVNGEPIRVLSIPHLVYQNRLLDGDETEVELCMLLLAQNGQKLAKCQPTSSILLKEFFVNITSRLLNAAMDKKTRCWLMLASHVHTQAYKIEPAFYSLFMSVLGAESMARVACALHTGLLELPIDDVAENSLGALKAGPPEDGGGDIHD